MSTRSLASTNVYLSAGYTFTGTQYVQQSRTRIEIDLNVRVRGNDTFVGFEDLTGPVAVGEIVEVYESESGVTGEGRVTEIDGDRELVYLSVDWSSLAEEHMPTYEEASTVTTQLLFVGASTTVTTAPQEPWIELVPRPCLLGIGGGNGAILVTAPIYESSGLLLDRFSEPYADMWQINVNFGNVTGVAA
jgi:hypothetical protein